MIFDLNSPRLLAVLDWELSTLGHPFADLAYQCMQWRLPNGSYRGLGGVDRAANGIPTETEYVAAYCRRMGLESIPDWTFLVAFSFFRSIAIHQGVYKRSLDGNASNPELARQVGESVPLVAHVAWKESKPPLKLFSASSRANAAALPAVAAHAKRPADPTARFEASPPAPERWQSGRSHRTRNAEYAQVYRGFESLPLRHRCAIHSIKSISCECDSSLVHKSVHSCPPNRPGMSSSPSWGGRIALMAARVPIHGRASHCAGLQAQLGGKVSGRPKPRRSPRRPHSRSWRPSS